MCEGAGVSTQSVGVEAFGNANGADGAVIPTDLESAASFSRKVLFNLSWMVLHQISTGKTCYFLLD